MLEGKSVDLRVVEKEDLPLLQEWWSNPEFFGKYNRLRQMSKNDIEKQYESRGSENAWFLILKKDGSRIGDLEINSDGNWSTIGFALIPSERRKGYCTEAVQIALDYWFMSKDVVSIHAFAATENVASQKVLEKTGFQREGKVRGVMFYWGKWIDSYLYGILREEWKEPRIIAKPPQQSG